MTYGIRDIIITFIKGLRLENKYDFV